MNWQAITPTALAALAVAVWCYLLVGRGFFWRVKPNLLPLLPPSARRYRVVAVIPARNEAAGIAPAIGSLLDQEFPGTLEIVLVDDGSTDGTAQLARAVACQTGDESRLTVLKGRPLPPGWSGKLWAVQQGLKHAMKRHQEPDFILLTDADICHAEFSVRELLAQAESRACDLTSVMVRLQCATRAEKLLIPAFVFFFFMLYPPRWVANRGRKLAGAAGGCMLLRTPALRAAGKMNLIRGEIIDDCALAALIKRNGGSLYLGLARETASVRSYETFAEVGNMIARTAFNQLRHSVFLLLGALLGLVLTYLVPVAAVIWGGVSRQPALTVAGAAGCLLMFLAYLPMVRYHKLAALWSVTLPVAAVFYSGATLLSAVRYWRGRGGQWKGRAQDLAQAPEIKAAK